MINIIRIEYCVVIYYICILGSMQMICILEYTMQPSHQHDNIQHGLRLCATWYVQYSIIQYSTVQYSTYELSGSPLALVKSSTVHTYYILLITVDHESLHKCNFIIWWYISGYILLIITLQYYITTAAPVFIWYKYPIYQYMNILCWYCLH